MSSASEITTEKIEASRSWVYGFYDAFDSFNLDYWLATFYKPDIALNLCNNPTMKGCEQIRAHFTTQQLYLARQKHDIKQIDVLPDRIYVQNEATFVVRNDPRKEEVKVKAVCLFWKNVDEEKTAAVDVYFDPTPLMERIQMFL